MRSATLFVLLGAVIANGCGSSSNGTGGGGSVGSAGTTGAGGSGAGTTGAGGSGAGTGGSPGSGGSGAQACGEGTGTGSVCDTVTITPSGPCVTATVSTGTAPTPGGGAISPGTYNLASVTVYNLPDAGNQTLVVGRETIVVGTVTAGSFPLERVSVSGTRRSSSSGTAMVTGTTVTFTRTCPPPGDAGDTGGTVGFTATGSSVTLIDSSSGDGSIEVSLYTK